MNNLEIRTNVVCWGAKNLPEQLNGAGECDVPANLGQVKQISSGTQHVAALLDDGTVRCWGDNRYRQCDAPNNRFPCAVKQVSAGSLTGVVFENGMMSWWGRRMRWKIEVECPLELEANQIEMSMFHNAVLDVDGVVRCWGYNHKGQCNVPRALSAVDQISVGGAYTAVLLSDGTVRCWGANDNGQCDVPSDLGEAQQISTGSNYSMVLLADGTVRCWGSNDNGQCDVPGDLCEVQQISAGPLHSMALLVDGTVRCWGNNANGQCDVPGDLYNVKQISAGGMFCSALAVVD